MATYTHEEIDNRRAKIQQYIKRGIETPSAISEASGFSVDTIKNDLRFFRRASLKWQNDQANNGYIWSLEVTEIQLQNMIEQQQKIRNDLTKAKVIDFKELRETTKLIAELMTLKFQVKTSAPAIASIQKMLEKSNERHR